MNDEFAKLKAEIENENTLEPETVGSQWSAGDTCGENGCTHAVHEIHHERAESEIPPHDSYSEFEYVCTIHGIVATE